MKTENCITYSIHENGVKTGTAKVCDPCAIILMTDELPLVQIFDGEGNRTDCGQYRTIAEVGAALAKSLKGEKLTMCGREMPNSDYTTERARQRAWMTFLARLIP
jgi:hypothetical protein